MIDSFQDFHLCWHENNLLLYVTFDNEAINFRFWKISDFKSSNDYELLTFRYLNILDIKYTWRAGRLNNARASQSRRSWGG